MALMCLEHMYYKHDTVAIALNRANAFSKVFGRYADLHPACLGKDHSVKRNASIYHPGSFLGTPHVAPPVFNPTAKVDEFSKYIFKHGDDRSRTRALLCSVFHHALHDRFFHARDLFLISHVQETIEKADTETQILYNRALVTLGLSAFRQGLISKAHECLSGICSNRVRELLAQGLFKSYEKDPEQEKIERRRQVPYHMHINPDLLESCHLISAMLLDLPQINRPAAHQQLVSKTFRKYMNSYRQQLFSGPPENTRDIIMASARALLAGEWRKACDLVVGSDVWNLIPDNGGERVREMLRIKIKEEAVRIFLLNHGSHYESISLAHLCNMFEMDEMTTRKIVSRMIHSKDIAGAWEQPDDVLVLYKVDPSPLQSLCLLVAEKVAYLVESNERLLDPMAGAYGYKEDWPSRDTRKYGDAGPRHKNGLKAYTSKYPPARVGGGRGRGGRGYGGRDRMKQSDRSSKRAPQVTIESQSQAPKASQYFRWGNNAIA